MNNFFFLVAHLVCHRKLYTQPAFTIYEKSDFSFDSALRASFMKFVPLLRRGGDGVCISLAGKSPKSIPLRDGDNSQIANPTRNFYRAYSCPRGNYGPIPSSPYCTVIFYRVGEGGFLNQPRIVPRGVSFLEVRWQKCRSDRGLGAPLLSWQTFVPKRHFQSSHCNPGKLFIRYFD